MLRKQKGSTLDAIRHSKLKSRLGREGRGRLFLENSSDPRSLFPSFFLRFSPFFLIFLFFIFIFISIFYFLVLGQRYFSHGSPSSPRYECHHWRYTFPLRRESIKAVGIRSSTSILFRCSASKLTLETLHRIFDDHADAHSRNVPASE